MNVCIGREAKFVEFNQLLRRRKYSTSSYPAHTTEQVNNRYHLLHFAGVKTSQSYTGLYSSAQ